MPEKQEPLILAIETSTRAGSVSLARGLEVLSAVLGDGTSSHSTDLIDNVERVLREGSARLIDIDLFAVTAGPGSFTGLRIGLATVKAFAVCVQKPCLPVSTLAAIAHAAGESERTVSILRSFLKNTATHGRSGAPAKERTSISRFFGRTASATGSVLVKKRVGALLRHLNTWLIQWPAWR